MNTKPAHYFVIATIVMALASACGTAERDALKGSGYLGNGFRRSAEVSGVRISPASVLSVPASVPLKNAITGMFPR